MREKGNKPPRLAEWLLKKVANAEDNRAIVGDFEEEYKETVQSKGALQACLQYWLVFLISFPSFISSYFYWRFVMFRNYLKITFRNIRVMVECWSLSTPVIRYVSEAVTNRMAEVMPEK